MISSLISSRTKMAKENKACVVPHCSRESKIRGLCPSCYQLARTLVFKGKITWAFLEEKGMAIPLDNNKTRRESLFMKAFKEKFPDEKS